MISSNKKYCVYTCQSINELNPADGSNLCVACKEDEFPFVNIHSLIECRKADKKEIIKEKIKQIEEGWNINSSIYILFNKYIGDIFSDMIKEIPNNNSIK